MSDDDETQTQTPRVRGSVLQRRRRRWFAIHPLCLHCTAAGRVRSAVELDHILPRSKGGSDDDDNLQGLCVRCHAAKTRIDLGHGPVRGCDAQGMPSDPTHPWHTQRK